MSQFQMNSFFPQLLIIPKFKLNGRYLSGNQKRKLKEWRLAGASKCQEHSYKTMETKNSDGWNGMQNCFIKNHDHQENVGNNRREIRLRIRILPTENKTFQTENNFYSQHSLVLMNVLTSVSTLNFHPCLSQWATHSNTVKLQIFLPPKSWFLFTENQAEHKGFV